MSENEKDENPPLVPDVSIKKSRPTRKFQKNDWQNKNSFDIKDSTKEELQRPIGDQQKIDELKELLEKEKQKSLQLKADYQNLVKAQQQKISDGVSAIMLGTTGLLSIFINIYEDFIRAKDDYAKDEQNVDNLNIIIKNMKSILENYDVKQIETIGKKSDPKLHEVVQVDVNNDLEEGTIVKEVAKGYIIHGEVVKYSKVCVSKKIIKE